jgi:hypothetical protein
MNTSENSKIIENKIENLTNNFNRFTNIFKWSSLASRSCVDFLDVITNILLLCDSEKGLVKTSLEGGETKEVDLFSNLKTVALRVLKIFIVTGIFKKYKENMNENALFHEKTEGIFKILIDNIRRYGGEQANSRKSRKIAAVIDVLGLACVHGGDKGIICVHVYVYVFVYIYIFTYLYIDLYTYILYIHIYIFYYHKYQNSFTLYGIFYY